MLRSQTCQNLRKCGSWNKLPWIQHAIETMALSQLQTSGIYHQACLWTVWTLRLSKLENWSVSNLLMDSIDSSHVYTRWTESYHDTHPTAAETTTFTVVYRNSNVSCMPTWTALVLLMMTIPIWLLFPQQSSKWYVELRRTMLDAILWHHVAKD